MPFLVLHSCGAMLPLVFVAPSGTEISSKIESNVLKAHQDMTNNNVEPIFLNSTDQDAVENLVMSLMQTKPTEYTVLNEHQEDITHEIKKLVSLKTRMLKG